MGSNYLFSLSPTFTQGLVLGQLSIVLLIALILKYIFLDSSQNSSFDTFSYQPRADISYALPKLPEDVADAKGNDNESAEWFNVLLQQIVNVYRSKLRDDTPGPEGDEIARIRIENYANRIRPPGFIDHIRIHSVDLGVSAPRVLNAHADHQVSSNSPPTMSFETTYKDTASISLSTAYLFNYPMTSFARLPISLTISLSQFKSFISITPRAPTASTPALIISILPDFTLDLTTTSLMGSRAKLANVPKLHELIQHQARRIFAARSTWEIALPGLSSMPEARDEVKREMREPPS